MRRILSDTAVGNLVDSIRRGTPVRHQEQIHSSYTVHISHTKLKIIRFLIKEVVSSRTRDSILLIFPYSSPPKEGSPSPTPLYFLLKLIRIYEIITKTNQMRFLLWK